MFDTCFFDFFEKVTNERVREGIKSEKKEKEKEKKKKKKTKFKPILVMGCCNIVTNNQIFGEIFFSILRRL